MKWKTVSVLLLQKNVSLKRMFFKNMEGQVADWMVNYYLVLLQYYGDIELLNGSLSH